MTKDRDRPVRIPDASKGLSKTASKKVLSLVLAKTQEHATNYETMQQREQDALRKLSNACAVLEAVVRRHGSQAFDRGEVESKCASGRIRWEVTPTRITVHLNDPFAVPPVVPD